MDICNYIARMKNFYISFLKYIEIDDNEPESLEKFITFMQINQFGTNPDELRSLLHIINKLSNHHKQSPFFKYKIRQILQHFINQIKQTFSNSDLFQIFNHNKLILSFLFDNKILTADEQIAYNLIKIFGKNNSNFFYPEIKPFLKQNSGKYILRVIECDEVNDPDFIKKRQEGQNDSYVCQLIRKDSIDEFQEFLKKQNYDVELIPDSIFESNNFLANREPTYIEYAAFYGSKKIFEFLQGQNELTSSLWLYAINGKNFELIELLRKNKIEPDKSSYDKCFIESIKCHYNEIAKSFLMDENEVLQKKQIFCFYNFEYFPNDFNGIKDELVLELACQYDYVTIVKNILQTGKINLKELLENSAIFFFTYFFTKFFLIEISNEINIIQF